MDQKFTLIKEKKPEEEQIVVAIGYFDGEIVGETDVIEAALVCYDKDHNCGMILTTDHYYANLYNIVAWYPVPDTEEFINGLQQNLH